jgi:BMFP domain-containing protein YqiC
VSDDPFFSAPDWKHPSQSIAASMRQRSAASSRASQAAMKVEQDSVVGLRELFEAKQWALDAAESRTTALAAQIAALEAQLTKTLSSDAPAVTDAAVAGVDLLSDRDVREGRVDAAAADSKGGDAADDAADAEPAVPGDVRGHAAEHAVPRRSGGDADEPAAAPDDAFGAVGAEQLAPGADVDAAAGAEIEVGSKKI